MFDLYSYQTANLRNELFRAEAAKMHRLMQVPGRLLCMPLGRRIKETVGNLLIQTGMRLKEQAYSQAEAAASPTFMITL